MYIYIKQN